MDHEGSPGIEYLTIFAPTAAEAIDQFSRRGLAALGYSITGQIGRHQIAVVGGEGAPRDFGDGGLVAATFHRRVAPGRA